MPYCVQCGTKVFDGAAFCTACGAPIPKVENSPKVSENTQAQGSAPPTPPTPPAQGSVPPPPPASGSQPGAFRVQMMRYKEATPPPLRNTTPPPSQAQQRIGNVKRKHRGGSSFGSFLRRGFHIFTAVIAFIASLSWGIKSAFPNLSFGNGSGIFSSCSGGAHDDNPSGDSTADNLPSAKDYKRVFTDSDLKKVFDAGFPETDEDHGICFGMFESNQKLQGNNVAFELKKASPTDDQRLVGKFILHINGKVEQEGFLCYCGHSIYSLFDDIEDIDRPNSTAGIWYVSADGKTLSIYDRGEEKMKWTLKE